MTAPHTVAGHTAGPWEMGQTPHSYEDALVSASGEVVAYAAWDGGSNCHLKIKNEHDARLIAAAPDLLAVVTAFAAHMEADTFAAGDTPSKLYKAARAAIAKATAARQSGEDA